MSRKPGITYIYDLPFRQRRELRNILDENDSWEDLAGNFMNIPLQEINYMKRQRSPTEVLLDFWGQRNHTVQELFVLLSEMEHYRAMTVLKDFIDEKHHSLIKERDDSISRLLSSLNKSAETKPKELNIADNFENLNIGRDFNIRGNYETLPQKQVEKTLNLEIPKVVTTHAKGDEARAITPEKGNSSSGSIDKNHTRESNIYTGDLKRANNESEIPFHELEKATNYWSEKNILGKGGFGTVYEGEWKLTKVAVKVFKKRQDGGVNEKQIEAQFEQLIKELQVLDSIRHDNILSVYGFSFGKGLVPCIVYQLMENGSLEDRLQCKKDTMPLTWYQRYEIARGTARGLQFLHTKGERPLIHGDIKSANILLDGNMKPYIGDFGLAREGPIPTLTHLTVLNVNGTKPYLPYDYLNSRQISTKVDTYSFGIVMFEISTGMRAFDKKRKPEAALKDLVAQKKPEELIDSRIRSDALFDPISLGIFTELMQIGKWCSKESAKERPEVVDVLRALDDMCVPSRSSSVAASHSQHSPTPMELQRAYDSIRQRTLSGDSSWNAGRHMTSRQSYPFAPSPSINIQEFSLSTPSTLPTQHPFPSPVPSANYRLSPSTFTNDQHQGLLMMQPQNIAPQYMNSPLLFDQQQSHSLYTPNLPPDPIQELSETGTAFIPTVLPGISNKEQDSCQESNFNVPLLTALGIKPTPGTNKIESDQEQSDTTDEDNEQK